MEVFWFKNNYEHRNDVLRFGFMRLNQNGQIRYREFPLQHCVRFGFSQECAQHEHRHTSLFLLRLAKRDIRCLVDSEDSFFWMCPLISEVDCYFCAGYNSEFFQQKRMFQPYPWQTEPEVSFYRKRGMELVLKFGAYFGAVRKFVPIAPSMSTTRQVGAVKEKWRNLNHKVHSVAAVDRYWKNDFLNFKERYSELQHLRQQPLVYDIVLKDTLWGWPRHRLKLHSKLKSMCGKYQIHSQLNWSDPVPYDGSASSPLNPKDFPIRTRPILSNYENMVASSRLGVYATGYHWGWRSIMSFALMLGLPIYMDKPVLEPWFKLDEFKIFWNKHGDWRDLEKHLNFLSETEWKRIKKCNQSLYDEVMAPERVAKYVIGTALT